MTSRNETEGEQERNEEGPEKGGREDSLATGERGSPSNFRATKEDVEQREREPEGEGKTGGGLA